MSSTTNDPMLTPRARGEYDAPHRSPVTPAEDFRTVAINRLTWGAVFAGIASMLAVQLVLNIVGVAAGVATLEPRGDSPDGQTLSIAAGLWWAISGIVAAGVGGYVAGRVCGQPKESTAGWHAFVAWAGAVLVIAFLIGSSVGSVVGAAGRTLGGALEATATAVAEATPELTDPFGRIEEAVRGRAANEPVDIAVESLRALLTGDPAQAGAARDRAAEALARATNVSAEQARAEIQRYENEYRQTVGDIERQAAEAAEAARDAVSVGAILAAVSLVLGAVAAVVAGRMGAVDPTLTMRPASGMAPRRRREPGL